MRRSSVIPPHFVPRMLVHVHVQRLQIVKKALVSFQSLGEMVPVHPNEPMVTRGITIGRRAACMLFFIVQRQACKADGCLENCKIKLCSALPQRTIVTYCFESRVRSMASYLGRFLSWLSWSLSPLPFRISHAS